ncbi:MAG: tetratricopeptide repeat protein [Spirochaetes bacterium]|nr:tetratricopeptide repeat protein [Spirochaetota bacterium]
MPLFVILIIVASIFTLYISFVLKSYIFPKKLNQIAKWLDAGNTRSAIKALKSFIVKNERSMLAHWYLGEAYYQEKKFELAIVEYKYVIKIGTFNTELTEAIVRKRLAEIYKEFNQLDEAQKEYILISNLEPDNFDVMFQIGELFYKRNLVDNSVSYFQKSIRLNPQHSDSHYYLGIIYFNSGQFEESQIELNRALQYNSKNFKAHLYLGLVYKALGQFDSAIREFEVAERDSNIKLRALLENGKTHYEKGNLSKAVVELERALKSSTVENEVSTEVRYWIANCYEKNRDLGAAIEQWETIAQFRPSYKDVPEKLTVYADLRTDDRLKDFLTASSATFQNICQKLINAMGYDIIELSPVTDEGINAVVTESEAKWRNVRRQNVIIRIRRVTGAIGELPVRELHEEMKKNSANRGMFITTSSFAPSASQYAATRPIDLVDKNNLTELLKKIEKK